MPLGAAADTHHAQENCHPCLGTYTAQGCDEGATLGWR
jgi:hypothetical protein